MVLVGGSYISFVYHGLLFWQPFVIYFSFYLSKIRELFIVLVVDLIYNLIID